MNLAALNEIDLSNIDLKNLGSTPFAVRLFFIVVLCAAIGGAGYYFDTRGQLEQLEIVQAKEEDLRRTFEAKQRKAANLEAYKVQLEEMRRSFGTMLRQLPSKTEIPGLIVDISQTGLASGLEIELFKPLAEGKRGFYAEKPIQLRVKGSYHEFGNFASGVASLPRIVTLHDITLRSVTGTDVMTMDATAKTYRYLEDGES
jgi:type IV pilus assembly protein PilO